MYISIVGSSVYYQKTGRGKDLILLHGWKQDVSSFWEIVDLLKDNFTLWLIDLPGFGRSEMPENAWKIIDYAYAVKEFIKQNGIKKPIILGHSFGGRVGIKLAANNPNLISKLILESSAGIKPKQDSFKIFFYILAKVFNLIIPDFVGLKEKMRYSFYKALESDYISAGDLKKTLTNILAEDLSDDISKITTETLLIWGEKDPTTEASLKNGKLIYKLIKNSKIEIFEDVGHFPHLENPERFTYYVKDFCS